MYILHFTALMLCVIDMDVTLIHAFKVGSNYRIHEIFHLHLLYKGTKCSYFYNTFRITHSEFFR